MFCNAFVLCFNAFCQAWAISLYNEMYTNKFSLPLPKFTIIVGYGVLSILCSISI